MQPTRDTSTLDLIFFDIAEYYEIPAIPTPLSTSDHNVINWKSKCNIAGKENLTIIGPPSLTPLALIEKSNTFLQITENMISEYFPEKTVRIYSKDKPFITSKIKRLILKRNIKKQKS